MKIQRCNAGHRMQRMYARHSVGSINQWGMTKYWYCPECELIKPAGEMKTAVVDNYGKASISRTLKGQTIEYRLKA